MPRTIKFSFGGKKLVNDRIGEWVGRYLVDDWDLEKELVFVRDSPVGPTCPFNLAQVMKYLRPEVSSHTFVFGVVKGLRNISHGTHTRKTEFIAPDDLQAKSTKKK